MEEYKKDDRGRSKAKRLTMNDPHTKVDSSTWTPDAAENAGVKTGARPLVKRLYKKGGKVVGKHEGKDSVKHAGRMPRKAGGRTEHKAPWVDDFINRDVRMANDKREGVKHDGAFKKGGKAHKASGGKLGKYINQVMENYGKSPDDPKNKQRMTDGVQMAASKISGGSGAKVPATRKSGGRAHKLSGGSLVNYINSAAADMGKTGAKQPFDFNRASKRSEGVDLAARKLANQNVNVPASGMKKGGKAHKLGGGMVGDNPLSVQDRSMAKASGMMKKGGAAKKRAEGGDAIADMIRQDQIEQGMKGRGLPERVPMPPRRPVDKPMTPRDPIPAGTNFGAKKGGKIKHPDEKADRQLIKSMIKPTAFKAKGGKAMHHDDCTCKMCGGGRAMKYSGGGIFFGDSKKKIPGVVPGGRTAHAKGGSTIRSQFNDAFRDARNQGLDTFEFNGKMYNTKMAPAAKAPAPNYMQPNEAYRPGQVQASDLSPIEPSAAQQQGMMGRQPQMSTEHGLFMGRPDQAGIVFSRNVPDQNAQPVYHGGDSTPDMTLSDLGEKRGGRTNHAKGGRTKGNTTIIIDMGGRKQMQPQPMGMGQMPNAPANPMRQPQQQPPMPPQGGMPPMPPMPPQGMPMQRKAGGRTSYPIDTGAGGANARLEKIDAYGLKPSKRK